MKIGYRATNREEITRYPADLLQISYWKRFGPTLEEVEAMASRCRELKIPYLLHPVFTPLSETDPDLRKKNLEELTRMAHMTDLGLILHDEKLPDGNRLSGARLEQYRKTLDQLAAICPLSIENATFTEDIDWFWKEMGGSITLDMGHFESCGIDSVDKTLSFPQEIIDRVEYVHMHRKNGEHGGILDHWPLTEDCPEVKALKKLVQRKKNISVILEVNEMDQVGKSIAILDRIVHESS